jgi:hypothetical protein
VLQANAIKRTALPTLTNRVLDQLVKGCQLAINSAVLLAKENRQLQGENKRQKKKRAKRRAFIATRGVLTIQEGLDRSQVTNIVPESRCEVLVKLAHTSTGPKDHNVLLRTCLTPYKYYTSSSAVT